MFELKKYVIKKAFNGYREGQIVAFNGLDAEKYKAFIVSNEKKTFIAPVVEAVETVTKTVKRGRKSTKGKAK